MDMLLILLAVNLILLFVVLFIAVLQSRPRNQSYAQSNAAKDIKKIKAQII